MICVYWLIASFSQLPLNLWLLSDLFAVDLKLKVEVIEPSILWVVPEVICDAIAIAKAIHKRGVLAVELVCTTVVLLFRVNDKQMRLLLCLVGTLSELETVVLFVFNQIRILNSRGALSIIVYYIL